ncbi:MAG: hypothetical protein K940chlam8_00860 [Chlamydiae bacterium]|nr:hypothetical protein [Chlamydiota bacterium]
MKRILFSFIFVSLFSVQHAFAFGPTAPQSKSKQKTTNDKATKKESREWVYLEGDYVLGRLNANLDAMENSIGPLTNNTVTKVSVRHAFKSGFKVGLGIFLSKFVELHSSWLYMQNDKFLSLGATVAQGNTITGELLNPNISITNGCLSTHLHDRTQIIDALIKSRRFFTHEKVSCLPVIGLRGILMDRNAKQVADNQTSSTVSTTISDVKVQLIGIVAGVDLKYMLSRYFNFFGSVYTGAVTGRYKQFIFTQTSMSDIITAQVDKTYKQSEDFREFFDATFGLSFNFDIGKTFNVLIRFGVYLFYFDSTHFGQMFNNPFNTTQAHVYGNTFQAIYAGGRITF